MSRLPTPDEYGNFYLGRSHKDLPQILRGGKGMAYDDAGRLCYDFPDVERYFVLTEHGPLWDKEDRTKLRYFDSPQKAMRALEASWETP